MGNEFPILLTEAVYTKQLGFQLFFFSFLLSIDFIVVFKTNKNQV